MVLDGKRVVWISSSSYPQSKDRKTTTLKQHVHSTHHVFEEGDLPVSLWDHVVACCLPAVHQRLLRLGPPDVRRPPDAGQQTGGATHRVVTGPGRLLVPGFDRATGDEQ